MESTILTDYIELSNKKAKDYVKIFEDIQLYPYPESFAYYKMITPYLVMTEGVIEAGEFKFNPSKMDQALEGGRGYYELMAKIDNKEIVLRFNIKAFRNNYSISDLVKMKLTFHAIEVGTVNLSKLSMESEFSGNTLTTLSGFDLINPEGNSAECIVYDVILAGVYR